MTRKLKAKPPAAAHTPLPWERNEEHGRGWDIVGPSGEWIATVNNGMDGDEENSGLIVRAVNAHDELVATLGECLVDIQDAHDNHIWDDDADLHPKSKDDCRYCCTIDRIMAALRRAKGEI